MVKSINVSLFRANNSFNDPVLKGKYQNNKIKDEKYQKRKENKSNVAK